MKIPYCLPIQKNTKAEVLRTIRANLSAYGFFEVWLDQVADRDDAFLLKLKHLLAGRLVIVSQMPVLDAKVIASYHDYQKTPDDRTLRSIIARMDRYRPAIYKIATYCNSPEDALRLLQLLLNLKKLKKKCIILGMGPHGAITRICGALWGNELVFAPRITAERSAPGQLTKNQLENILRNLNNKN